MRYASEATPRLLWFNFAPTFFDVPSPTLDGLDGVSELASQPAAFYVAVFLLVNGATYIALIWELIGRAPAIDVSFAVRKVMRARSITTLCLFGLAAVV